MAVEKLYAWADKTHIGVGEHTWITTYSTTPGMPDESKGKYWYCCGDSRQNYRELCVGTGGVEFALSIAQPHPYNKKESAGIKWGHDGLCHQIANRLLRFSLNTQGQPAKVENAKGYQMTVGMFGEYGGKSRLIHTDCLTLWLKTVKDYENRKGR